MCSAEIIDPLQCQKCQLVFSKYEEIRIFKKNILFNKRLEEDESNDLISNQDDLNTRRYAFPFIGLIAFIGANSFLTFLFGYFKVWVHEFGHALMSWLSGIKATPISFWIFGLTWRGEEKSTFVFLSFSLLMFVTFKSSIKHRIPFLRYLSIFLFSAAIFCTWYIPIHKTEELITFAGFGGELALATVLIIAFFYRLPEKWHWENFFRWPFLFIGFYTLIFSSQDWLRAMKLKNLSPFGENFSEDAVSGVPGDLYGLMYDFDWSYDKFIRIYLTLAIFCWVIVLGHYFYFSFFKSSKKLKNFR